MTRFLRHRIAFLLLPVLVGCQNADEPAAELPIPQDTYVDVMVELTRLKRLPPPARGEPERQRLSDSIRAEILTRHGVTAAEIVAFADIAGRDPTLMMGLSQAIAERADSIQAALARGDSVPSSGRGAAADPAGGKQEEAEAAGAAEDAAPAPRFAEPSDSVTLDRPADTARIAPRRPPGRPIERPLRSRDPD
jgi:hypothetical protein